LIRDRSVVIKMHKIAKCLHIPHFLIKLPDKIKKKKKKRKTEIKIKQKLFVQPEKTRK